MSDNQHHYGIAVAIGGQVATRLEEALPNIQHILMSRAQTSAAMVVRVNFRVAGEGDQAGSPVIADIEYGAYEPAVPLPIQVVDGFLSHPMPQVPQAAPQQAQQYQPYPQPTQQYQPPPQQQQFQQQPMQPMQPQVAQQFAPQQGWPAQQPQQFQPAPQQPPAIPSGYEQVQEAGQAPVLRAKRIQRPHGVDDVGLQ